MRAAIASQSASAPENLLNAGCATTPGLARSVALLHVLQPV